VPAPIVNGGADRPGKVQFFGTSEAPWPWP